MSRFKKKTPPNLPLILSSREGYSLAHVIPRAGTVAGRTINIVVISPITIMSSKVVAITEQVAANFSTL